MTNRGMSATQIQDARRDNETSAASDCYEACEWGQYCFDDVEGSLWHTACHDEFCINDEGPVANGMKFCCYCGKPLIEQPYVDEEETAGLPDLPTPDQVRIMRGKTS